MVQAAGSAPDFGKCLVGNASDGVGNPPRYRHRHPRAMNEAQTNLAAEKAGSKTEMQFAIREARLVFIAALLALAVRFLTVPWDVGGCFLQVWMSLVGTAGFSMLLARLKTGQRILASCVLVPCLLPCFFNPIFFSPRTYFPFFCLGAAVWGMFWLGSMSRPRWAMLVALTLIPIGVLCVSGVEHMVFMTRFRGLKGNDLREIRLVAAQGGRDDIVISEPAAVARIEIALHSTWPYSPNHEGIPASWQMMLVGKDGRLTRCQIGSGIARIQTMPRFNSTRRFTKIPSCPPRLPKLPASGT